MTSETDNRHRLATAPIVVGVDGTTTCENAIRWAADTAAHRGRRLHLVHGLGLTSMRSVLGSYDVMEPAVTESLRTRGERMLAAAVHTAREVAPEVTIATELTEEDPAAHLITLSESAHMVVLGARAGAGTLSHLGSTLLKVAAHGHGAVVVVHDTDPLPALGPVVVGVDGSGVGVSALAAAFEEAAERDAELRAVHAWSDLEEGAFAGADYLLIPIEDGETAERAVLAERLAGFQEKYPDVTVVREVHPNGPRRHLAAHSAVARLVVVGSRGRGGFHGLLLGSTSLWIMQHAGCPVMIVHPE
ncbi:universal stress protein [Nocardia takedensis]|uniref:universal stress protein n=1 Tax=Nocardia takedensis TaxID=259390 RepID=UPI003F75C141